MLLVAMIAAEYPKTVGSSSPAKCSMTIIYKKAEMLPAFRTIVTNL